MCCRQTSVNSKKSVNLLLTDVIIIIMTITIFKEDNVFSIIASLPYGPPVNIDIDYYRTFFSYFFMFVSVAMLVVRYLLGEKKPVLAL